MNTHWGMSRLDWMLLVLAAVGSVAIVMGLKLSLGHTRPGDAAWSQEETPPVLSAAYTKTMPRLAQADAEDARACRTQAGRVADFFQKLDGNERAFAKEMLSFESQWKCFDSKFRVTSSFERTWGQIQDFFGVAPQMEVGAIELGGRDAHTRYVDESFGKHFFSPEELESLVRGCIAAYLAEAERIENELLVALQADLAGGTYAPNAMPTQQLSAEFRRQFDVLAVQMLSAVGNDVAVNVGSELATVPIEALLQPLVAQVMSAVAVELGFSTAAASSGVVTLGAGLVVWWLSSELIDWVLKEAGYDPEAEIAAKVRESVEKIRAAVEEAVVLELEKLHVLRCRARNQVLINLILEGGKP
jgi:hypothetical protein